MPTSPVIDNAQQLAAAGRHADVVEYLRVQPPSALVDSPSLALLYGTAQARLGLHEEGLLWLDLALEQARKKGEQAVERHALNARGAIALVSGRIDEAADYFTQGLMAASRDGDAVTTGRCSNNLGVISNLRGRHAEAIGSWEIAVAAFEQAGARQGVAECHHNLAIAYREQGDFDRALTAADKAVAAAEAAGDRTLVALTLRGRVEIRLARGEHDLARHNLDRVREARSGLQDTLGEAEDLRVTAALVAADGELAAAERMLREVIGRAEPHGRPQLVAEATRDLAVLLQRAGRKAEAEAAARKAQAIFTRLGAEGEIRNLAALDWDEQFAAELRGAIAPIHVAQGLADAGRYTELLTYVSKRSPDELEQSPMLTLLCGIAHSRLGRLALGQQWAMVAQLRARLSKDRALEVRALNVSGAIALERGGIDEATYFFTRAQEQATEDNDMATVGRCANNLGVIANLRGDYNRAVGAYARAVSAYQTAGLDRGMVESQHNLGITYREQGKLEDALAAADAAVQGAERLSDQQLEAQALAGRAEIQVARGQAEVAIREAERALQVHHLLKDTVRETEDMRILAGALGLAGRTQDAEAMLGQVIDRATQHDRPLLIAAARRDLAQLLARKGDAAAGKTAALMARATYARLGARKEMDRLDAVWGQEVQDRHAASA